ncbi:MAG: hypothetical protein H7833_10225, partial [Magnetococcus sp. DMHC-1]
EVNCHRKCYLNSALWATPPESMLSLPEMNQNFAKARHPRCLHLEYATQSARVICVELKFSERLSFEKSNFTDIMRPSGDLVLSHDGKRVLKQWLSSRYGRPAFPNAFEKRLRKKYKQKTVEKHIAKIIESESKYLVGIFLDFGDGKLSELPEGVPYVLSMSIVYDVIEGGLEATRSAEKISRALYELFIHAFGKFGVTTEIALEKCTAVADDKFSLADLRRVIQWRLEYLSLREHPAGYFLAAGDTPT